MGPISEITTCSHPQRTHGRVASLFLSISQCLFPSALVSDEELGRGRPFAPPVSATPGDRSRVVCQLEVKIDRLPDEVLLDIFGFYRAEFQTFPFSAWKWQTLAHVCQRWRDIVLTSPWRLDLRIACNANTPAKKSLDIWPPFPISVTHVHSERIPLNSQGEENILAALEERHRIHEISFFGLTDAVLERFTAAMEESLPALRHFSLYSLDIAPAVLPETLLGGSAPRLLTFALDGMPFPSLPNFILSASHLQLLHLYSIPHAGYISPQAMASFLPSLSKLEHLLLDFQDPQSRPIQVIPPPLTRAILPALTRFRFSGASEYLEDFTARIDTPLLNGLRIMLFSNPTIDISRFQNFIDRAERLKPLCQAEVVLSPRSFQVVLGSPTGRPDALRLEFQYCLGRETIAQICNQLSSLLSQVEWLFISEIPQDGLEWEDDADRIPWLELLIPFVSAKGLHITEKLAPRFAVALQDLTRERVTEILPALHDMNLEGLQPSGSLW